jgi:hypothetical protein
MGVMGMNRHIDKQKLVEHLELCIRLEEQKGEQRVAGVLRNLKEEIVAGAFDGESDG